MCVFETHTSEKRLNDVFQGMDKYLIFQSRTDRTKSMVKDQNETENVYKS